MLRLVLLFLRFVGLRSAFYFLSFPRPESCDGKSSTFSRHKIRRISAVEPNHRGRTARASQTQTPPRCRSMPKRMIHSGLKTAPIASQSCVTRTLLSASFGFNAAPMASPQRWKSCIESTRSVSKFRGNRATAFPADADDENEMAGRRLVGWQDGRRRRDGAEQDALRVRVRTPERTQRADESSAPHCRAASWEQLLDHRIENFARTIQF